MERSETLRITLEAARSIGSREEALIMDVVNRGKSLWEDERELDFRSPYNFVDSIGRWSNILYDHGVDLRRVVLSPIIRGAAR